MRPVNEKKFEIIKHFLDEDVTFIETGTHLGYTSNRASEHCKYVHTCEIVPRLQVQAASLFSENEKVSFHAEPSADMLKKIANGRIDASPPYVFWLDAHAENSAKELEQQTLKKELKLIKELFDKEEIRALLVDDSSGLTLAPELMTVQECCEALLEINPNFRISAILRGGHYNGPTPYDADVLMAYDADFFEMTLKYKGGE